MLKRLNDAKKVENRLRRSLELQAEKLQDAIARNESMGAIEKLTSSKYQCAERLRQQSDHLKDLQDEARHSWL